MDTVGTTIKEARPGGQGEVYGELETEMRQKLTMLDIITQDCVVKGWLAEASMNALHSQGGGEEILTQAMNFIGEAMVLSG